MKIEQQLVQAPGVFPGKLSKNEPDKQEFDRLWNVISDMSTKQNQANDRMEAVLTGASDDTHGALIALQKTELQMQLAVTVRDKTIQGFNQIINMQI